MNTIKVVKGNSFWLQIDVTKKIIGGSASEPMPLDSLSERAVILRKLNLTTIPSYLDETKVGRMYAHVEDMPIGCYNLEVVGKFNGNKIRSAERCIVQIVNYNAEGSAPSGEYAGEDSYSIDLCVELYTGTAIAVDDIVEGSSNAARSGAVYDALKNWETEINSLEDRVEKKINKPVLPGAIGQILSLGSDGKPVWVNNDSLTPEQKQALNSIKDKVNTSDLDGILEEYKEMMIDPDLDELRNVVFPLTAQYTSHNAGTYEVGTSVAPTASFNITRKGKDVSAQATVTASGTTIASNKKSWTAPALSSGSKTYSTSVNQGGQTVNLGNLTWSFTTYRYRGEVSAEPTDYATAIKALATQELSSVSTLGSTALSANKYYLFAVAGLTNFVVRHAQTGGEISGCKTGSVSIARKNGTGSEVYSYVLVPKSSSNWNFTISNS